MNLNLVTSLFFCLFFGITKAQTDTSKVDAEKSKFSFLYDDSRQHLGSVSLSYQIPTTTGTNFLGNGFKGKGGYIFDMKLFPYKHFFIGYADGSSNLDVVQPSIVGNFESSRLRERFFYVGYEFLPFKSVRFGVHTSIGGRVTLINNIPNNDGFRDTGRLFNFGFYVDYEFAKNLSVFADYSFRRMRSDILVPQALESIFETGTYNSLGLGLKFSFGSKDLFGQFSR